MLTERVQTPMAAESLSLWSPEFPEYRLPGPDTTVVAHSEGMTARHDGRPLAGAHLSFWMRRAESAAEAPERSRGDVAREHVGADSRPGRAIGHHRCDERAAGPEDDAVVVPRVVDPARLVKHADAPDPADEAIELARVLYVGKEIEQ